MMLSILKEIANPQQDFLKRILGNQTEVLNIQGCPINLGIHLHVFEIAYSSIDEEPEDKTYLSLYPITDDRKYLQLTFFPEYDLKESSNFYKVLQLVFTPDFFNYWPMEVVESIQPFRFDRSLEQSLTLTHCSKGPINMMLEFSETKDFIQRIRMHEIAVFLLRLSLEAYIQPNDACKLPACSFLNNSNEREKVLEAYSIILTRLENPITIRELAREVGINECYLKKGFKAMYGKTIHSTQQELRIEKAKNLLLENKYSVNEVAYKMGFGSPSHFSTSFKKITGMKPCELLG